MELLLGIFIAIAGILVVLLLRSLTTFFHEMGHAIPALLLTDGPVHVYIGTYGARNNGFHLNFGRLQIFFQFNLLDWKLGMCMHHTAATIGKSALIILGGPIASLLISVPLMYVLLNYQLSQNTTTIIAIFVFAASIDFVVNMIPWGKPIIMDSGTVSYCDGYQLLQLFSRSRASKEFFELEQKYQEGKFQELLDDAEKLVLEKKADAAVFQVAILACMQSSKSQDGLWFYEKMNEQLKLGTLDYFHIANFYLDLNNDVEALKCLDHFLSLQNDSPEALKSRGKIHLRQQNFALAAKDFQLAIYYNPKDSDLWLCRGLSKLKLNDAENGIKDLLIAEKMGEKNPELFVVLEGYYDKIGDEKMARDYYWKNQKSR